MNRYYIKPLLGLILCFLTHLLIAQDEAELYSMGVIDFYYVKDKSRKTTKAGLIKQIMDVAKPKEDARRIQDYVLEVFTNDKRFKLVDRSSWNFVVQERELQKTEAFIDGIVVEQGKSIGAEYLLSGTLNYAQTALTLTVYSVTDKKIKAKKTITLKAVKLLSLKLDPLKTQVTEETRKFISELFTPLIKVIKITDGSKNKAKEILIAGGKKLGLKKGNTFVVKAKKMIEVEGVLMEREEKIAVVEILVVENDNFSVCEVLEGKKELVIETQNGTPLYCYFTIGD